METSGGLGGGGDRGGPGMFDSFEERFELIIAILLGLAAIVGAIAAYETGLKDGDTLEAFQGGNRSADRASRLKTEAAAKRAEDQIVTTFALQPAVNSQLDALQGKGEELSDDQSEKLITALIDAIGSKELKKANKACNDDPDCDVPIDSKYYVVAEQVQAETLDKKADKQFATANVADKRGDDFSLVTVLLATALFLYGVAAVGRGRAVKLGMASLGGVIFVVSVIVLVSI